MFLSQEYFCDGIEVIEDTKFDERVWVRVPGDRGAKHVFVGNIYMSPESKNIVKDIQRKFREDQIRIHTHKKQSEVVP